MRFRHVNYYEFYKDDCRQNLKQVLFLFSLVWRAGAARVTKEQEQQIILLLWTNVAFEKQKQLCRLIFRILLLCQKCVFLPAESLQRIHRGEQLQIKFQGFHELLTNLWYSVLEAQCGVSGEQWIGRSSKKSQNCPKVQRPCPQGRRRARGRTSY